MTPTTHAYLDPRHSALLVVDVQERFGPIIADFGTLVAGCDRLVTAFRLLDLPVLATEQYPRGLGVTVSPLRETIGGAIPEKTAFSSFGCDAVPPALAAAGVKSVLVCGIETHVCVAQTVRDLLGAGYATFVVVDAVRSRDGHAVDREVALRRMEREGAVLTTAEAACFELMRDAKHPQFKQVQALFK